MSWQESKKVSVKKNSGKQTALVNTNKKEGKKHGVKGEGEEVTGKED